MQKSALVSLLKALVPYSPENLALSFKPSKFFADLERSSGHSKITLNQAYRRARLRGFLTTDTIPRLTAKGRLKLAPFVAKQLSGDAKLMIVFDIPERSSILRSQFRRLLKNLAFEQVQKSVWVTGYDHREVLCEAIHEIGLTPYVQLYECALIDTATVSKPNIQKTADRNKSVG